MSAEQISTMAKLYAERLMRGDRVSEAEIHVIIAGLMLSVDKLANTFSDLQQNLWSEEKLRELIREEVKRTCAEKRQDGGCKSGGLAAWFGRLIRGFTGVTACAGLLAAGGCRTIRVDATNANGSNWRVSETAFFWESQVESLAVDGVGVVSGYKGGTDEAALRAAVEAAVSAAVKGAL